MSEQTRQAVLMAIPNQGSGPGWIAFYTALDAHVADERRRAVAAVGCTDPSWVCALGRFCPKHVPLARPCGKCAPCRAQAEVDAEGS